MSDRFLGGSTYYNATKRPYSLETRVHLELITMRLLHGHLNVVTVSSMTSIFCNAKRRQMIEISRKCFRISHMITEFHDYTGCVTKMYPIFESKWLITFSKLGHGFYTIVKRIKFCTERYIVYCLLFTSSDHFHIIRKTPKHVTIGLF